MWDEGLEKGKGRNHGWGEKNSKDEEIFEEYLDSLEIN